MPLLLSRAWHAIELRGKGCSAVAESPCITLRRGLDALSAAIVIGVIRKIADEAGMLYGQYILLERLVEASTL